MARIASMPRPLALAAALAALCVGRGGAWNIDSPAATPPEDIVGEHQPLARTLVISSADALESLYLAIPGRVFVEIDPASLPVAPTEPPTEAPTEAPVVPVASTSTPEVTEAPTEAPEATETPSESPEVTEAPTEIPLPVLPPVERGSGSGAFVGNETAGSGPRVSGDAIVLPTQLLRRHRDEDEDEEEGCGRCHGHDEKDEDEDEGCGRCHGHKKHGKKGRRHAGGEDAVVARVVITGDSAELLDMIEAVPVSAKRADALKLHLKNADGAADGFLLTTVFLTAPRALRSVTTAFDGAVVVDERVLALTDDREVLGSGSDDGDEEDKTRLSLSVVGDGDLLVVRRDSSPSGGRVSLGSLSLVVTGSGSVQLPFLSGAALALSKSLEVDVAGSGAVVLAPDAVAAHEVSASVTGSGSIVVEATGAVAVASSLELSVFGSGALSLASSGSVPKEKLQLSGAGQLLAGSIAAGKADVSVWGTGLVLVQAVDALAVSTSVWGSVGYVNARPARVKISGWWFWRSADQIVYPAAENVVIPAELDAPPPEYPTYYLVRTSRSYRDDDPDYTIVTTEPDDEDEGGDDDNGDGSDGVVSLAAALDTVKTGDVSAVAVVAAATIALAVAAVTIRAVAQFRVRRQYTRLE